MARILLGCDYLAIFNSPRTPRAHTLVRVKMKSLRRLWRPLDAAAIWWPASGFDLVHTINRIPLTSKPWITTFESIVPRTIGARQELFRDSIRGRLLSPSCKRIIAMSQYAVGKGQLHNRGWRKCDVLMEKISVIHPNVAPRPRHGSYSGGELSVVFVGNDFARKGGISTLRMAKQAFKMRLPVKFHIVSSLQYGPGIYTDYPDKTAYADDIKLLDLPNVQFHGTLSNAAVLELMARSHFVLLQTMDDTYGFSVLEGMAAGTPAIVSAVCALPEFVHSGKNGFALKLPLGDDGDWAHWDLRGQRELWDALDEAYTSLASDGLGVIADTLERPESWQVLSQGAIEHIRTQHDAETNGSRIEQMYTEALAS
jgi:glycosyltransferase involved in cell wall biosynthesis